MKKIILVVLVLVLVILGIWGIIKSGIFTKNSSYVNNSEVLRVRNNGVLRVGLDATYSPMEYLDSQDNIVGFDADMATLAAKEFGVPVQLVNIGWDDIFNQLDEGKIDVIISSVTINSERSKLMSFSKPYFNAGQVIVTLAGNNLITDKLDLEGKKVGVQSGTTSEKEAKILTEEDMVLGFVDYDMATEKLREGEVDALIMDYPVAVNKVKNELGLKLVGGPFTQEFYGIVVAKGKEELLQPINVLIEKLIKTGEIKKIENKWLN